MADLKHTIDLYDKKLKQVDFERVAAETALLNTQRENEDLKAALEVQEKAAAHSSGENEFLVSKLKESLGTNQKMLIEINNLKEFIDWVKKKNAELMQENDHLKMTIGTNYYDLTPRPDWRKLAGDLKECSIKGRQS